MPPRPKKAKKVSESKHYNQPEKHQGDDVLATVSRGEPLIETQKYRSKSAEKKEKEVGESNV